MGYNRPDLQRDYDLNSFISSLFNFIPFVTTDLIYKGIMTRFLPVFTVGAHHISYNRPDLQRDFHLCTINLKRAEHDRLCHISGRAH